MRERYFLPKSCAFLRVLPLYLSRSSLFRSSHIFVRLFFDTNLSVPKTKGTGTKKLAHKLWKAVESKSKKNKEDIGGGQAHPSSTFSRLSERVV